MIGALAYRADGSRSKILLQFKKGAVLAPDFVRFLEHLARHLRGNVLVIWDRLNGHRSLLVRNWSDANPRFEFVHLPAYAPELNPVEALWSWLKGTCLANCSHDDLGPLTNAMRRGVHRARHRKGLLCAFLRKADLHLTRVSLYCAKVSSGRKSSTAAFIPYLAAAFRRRACAKYGAGERCRPKMQANDASERCRVASRRLDRDPRRDRAA